MAHVEPKERTVTAVDYPSSDGKPVAESDFQPTVLTYAREAAHGAGPLRVTDHLAHVDSGTVTADESRLAARREA